jgi:hypothetical protein
VPPPTITRPPTNGNGAPLPTEFPPPEPTGPTPSTFPVPQEFPWPGEVPLTVILKAFRIRPAPNNDNFLWASSLVAGPNLRAAIDAHLGSWPASTFQVWDINNQYQIFGLP